ncbi:Dehydrogenase xptC [Paramyrothecium foliicola]|nr:Dehydrogenase xptC [Paramyrothecium foliicola]
MSSVKIAVLTLLVAAGRLASAWPRPPLHARILEKSAEVADEYDYIIVGGGTSGLTVGDRLTENGQYTVLVLEYGQYHSQTGMHASRMFNITSQRNPELGNRQFSVGIGCAVGGSSIVNGQVMQRGTKPEYDAWKELGGPGSTWDWDNLLPYFRKGITLSPPKAEIAKEFRVKYNKEYWGTETPIYATYGNGRPANVTKLLYDAMASIPDMNIAEDSGSGENGLYWYSTSHIPGTNLRSYARTGHWDNVKRDNYELVVGAKVNRILFDDDLTATGVQFVPVNNTSAQPRIVKARREVILAAGTIHTPQILQLSGIGPSAALEDVGIEVKVDLPGVGSNFQDHSYIPFIGFQWGVNPGGAAGDGMVGSPNLLAQVGLPVLSPDNYEAITSKYEEQDPTSHLPESYTTEQIEGYRKQQAVYTRLLQAPDTTVNSMMMNGPGGSIQNLHPLSRGIVSLNPADPEGEVIVDYRAATNELDLEVMVENVRFMRRYMASDVFKPYAPREFLPGTTVRTTEQLISWVRNQIIPSVYHPVGTCAKVPREHGGCVDEQLLVYGTQKLSIIDASMMPTLVGATTQMTVYAVAEKAADLIKERTFD